MTYGGGIKTSTFIVVLASIMANIKGRKQSVLFKKAIPLSAYTRAISIFLLSLFLIIGTAFLLTLFENNPLMDNIFEAVSAFGTVGLSTGITPSLTLPGKIAIIIAMFAGRVGPLTLAYVLGEKGSDLIKYPEGNILIG